MHLSAVKSWQQSTAWVMLKSYTCQVHQVQLGLQELGSFAVRGRIWLAPLLQSEREDGMRPAGRIIQVVGSHSPVPVASFQQLSNVCLCLHLYFPAHSKTSLRRSMAD